MSHYEEDNNPKFQWGKKRGIGGSNKKVQFYESFTYGGVEYFLYDCVYLNVETEPEPYIGKLVKIWEHPNRVKKVKVVWFFRPIEIINWLKVDAEPKENELFLASGEGLGVANVNPLETIIGKCNIICMSKDERNPQPSEAEVKMADFFFYRSFDVGSCTISDKIDDKIGDIEVRYFFNKKNDDSPASISKFEANGKDELEKMVGSSKASYGNASVTNTVAKESREDVDLKVNQKFVSSISEAKTDSDRQMGKADDAVEHKGKQKSFENSSVLDTRPSKKIRLSKNSVDPTKELHVVSDRDIGHGNTSGTPARTSEGKVKIGSGKDFIAQDKKSSVELKGKPSDATSHKTTTAVAPDSDLKANGQLVEVTRRPDADRRKWFKALPWEERIQRGHEQGTLALLENLDPSYTSTEIEDVIWHALMEKCNAKVVQRTQYSSPHSGQAFVIFKSRDAAALALKKLNEDCLLLPNGRPLVCSRVTPRELGKPLKFFGHLSIDSTRRQMREESKNAVSTSHCSQANTIEYEMAMEWRVLQQNSENWWKELFKQHGEEMRKARNFLNANNMGRS